MPSGEPFALGDRILTLTNDHRRGVINGERGIVTHVDPRAASVQFDTRQRHTTTIPAAYIDAGGLDYGYAMTIHKAQGLTCDRAYVLGDEHLHREAAYTALSRGRHENHLHTARPAHDVDAHHDPEPEYDYTMICRTHDDPRMQQEDQLCVAVAGPTRASLTSRGEGGVDGLACISMA